MDENRRKNWCANQFKEIRKQYDLTQEQLAERLGYEVATIRKVEQERRLPSEPVCKAVKKVFGVDLTPPPDPDLSDWDMDFVGREDDLEALKNLFEEDPQRKDPQCCVTILGQSGAGKTRLAAQYGLTCLPSMKVYFVKLESLTIYSAESLLSAIASKIGLKTIGRVEMLEAIIRRLRTKSSLLILDNFEDFVGVATSVIPQLLTNVENLHILITSRHRLNIPDETVYDLSGLSLQASIDLFARVAHKQILSRFDLNNEREYVKKICEWMKGLPLGIRFVAGLVRDYSCAEILNFLQTGEMKEIGEMDLSLLNKLWLTTWKRLDDNDQHILRQLCVFKGGFTKEAAQSVTGITPAQLGTLRDQSWLQRTWLQRSDDRDPFRYYFHPLTLSFLQNTSSPTLLNITQQQHTYYYINLLAQHGDTLRHEHPQEAKQILLPETANLQEAHSWLVSQTDTDRLATFIPDLFHLYKTTWELPLFTQLLQKAISLPADTRLTAEWERTLAESYFRMGEVDKSLKYYRKTLDRLHAPHPDPRLWILLKPTLHYLCKRLTPMFSVSQSTKPSRNMTLALAYEKMGMIYYIKNDAERMISSCLHGYNRARESKNGEAIAYTSMNLSFAWIALKRPGQTKHHIKQALKAIEPYNSHRLRAIVNGRQTVYYNSIGEWDEGQKLSDFAIEAFKKLELWREYGEQQVMLCLNLFMQGKHQQIIDQIEELKTFHHYGQSDQMLAGLLAQAYSYIYLEEWEQAEELVDKLGEIFDPVRLTGTMETVYHTVMSLWWTHKQKYKDALDHIQQVDDLLQNNRHNFAMFACFAGAIEAGVAIQANHTDIDLDFSQKALQLTDHLLGNLKRFCRTYSFATTRYNCYEQEIKSSGYLNS